MTSPTDILAIAQSQPREMWKRGDEHDPEGKCCRLIWLHRALGRFNVVYAIPQDIQRGIESANDHAEDGYTASLAVLTKWCDEASA